MAKTIRFEGLKHLCFIRNGNAFLSVVGILLIKTESFGRIRLQTQKSNESKNGRGAYALREVGHTSSLYRPFFHQTVASSFCHHRGYFLFRESTSLRHILHIVKVNHRESAAP